VNASTILLVTGGGLYLGSVTAAGGIYDDGGHDADDGTPVVRMQPGFDDVAAAVVRAVAADHGPAVVSTLSETGYSGSQLARARRQIDADEPICVQEGDRIIFKGTLGEA
jgi:hypothetical protein